MPPVPGMMHWHSLIARHAKSIRTALSKGLRVLDAQLSGQPRAILEPIKLRHAPKHPLHPLARIRQTQSRWFSTARQALNNSTRSFSSSSGPTLKYDRSKFPSSNVGNFIRQSTGRAPFASTLRPNLTGGALGRTAGGYTMGSGRIGGARHFSHGPASQAQVVQNVSQAMRAFFISGQKAQFDGVTPRGEKRFKAVSTLQSETGRKMRSLPKTTPGSWIDFRINPTITALTPLGAFIGMSDSSAQFAHLNSDGLLDVLSVDFSRSLKDLAGVLNDLKRLAVLGDLPITHDNAQNIRVHFPGCDADSVERLCDELHVQHGVVVQDPAFDAFVGSEIALLFPYAPTHDDPRLSDDRDASGDYVAAYFDLQKPKAVLRDPQVIMLEDMLSAKESAAEAYSTLSDTGFEDILLDDGAWLSSPSGYQSVRSRTVSEMSDKNDPLEYQGFEGIYRFIEELDSLKR